jgi:hypothetical protein
MTVRAADKGNVLVEWRLFRRFGAKRESVFME